MSTKKILILGGSKEQVPMIKLANALGHYTIVVDKNPDSPGFSLADLHYEASIRDPQAILRIADKEKVDGLASMITEAGVISMFEVCQKLGLPNSYSYESAVATVQKNRMRELLASKGLDDIKFTYPQTFDDAQNFALRSGFPLVMKSSDTGGQNGLFKVDNFDELRDCFSKSQADSYLQRIILEQYLSGPEMNVVFTVYKGQVMDLIISDRMQDDGAFGIGKRHSFPSRYTGKIQVHLREKCQKITTALSIENGVVFPQFIYSVESDTLSLIELGVRIPGGVMNQLTELAMGIDLKQFGLDIALGQVKDYQYYLKEDPKPAVIVTFTNADPGPLRTGVVGSVHGLDTAISMTGIANLDFYHQSLGDLIVTPLRSGKDRFFYIVSYGDSLEDAHIAAKKAFQEIRLLEPDGTDLKVIDFDFDGFFTE